MNILPAVLNEINYLVSIRRHLHKNPELSLQEYATAAYVEEQLESMGIACRRVGETGILGTITGKTGAGKKVLLRAELDALPIQEESDAPYRSRNPGVMHACGHDVHMASLLGAAKILQSMKNSFSGQILLAFQQAEEFGHGSRFFLSEDAAKDVDRVLGVHVSPDFPVGTLALVDGADAASCDYFKITVKGKDAHISKPWQGIDALYIASLLVTRLKTLAQQLAGPNETALIGVGKIVSGIAYNVIAGDAVIEGTTRAFSYEMQDLLRQKVTELTERLAAENGGSASVEFETFTAALINDSTAFSEVYKIAETIVGPGNVCTDKEKIVGLGADDFAEYLKDAKGVYVHVGTRGENLSPSKNPLHSSKFDVDEQALLVAATLFISYSLSILKTDSSS